MKIKINGLIAYCYVGIRSWEKVLRQKVIVDCELSIHQSCAIQDIDDTVSYSVFTSELVNFMNTNKFSLLETMALELLNYIMKNKKICHCYLRLYKPLALMNNANISVAVESKKVEDFN